MGSHAVPKAAKPPPAVDESKAMIAAINLEAINRKIRKSQGSRSTFLSSGGTFAGNAANNQFTGQ